MHTRDTHRPLLLIIDLQQGWRHKTATEAAMLRTVELCRQFTGDIIHCCFRNDPKSLFQSQLGWRRMVDSPDTDEIPEIAELQLPKYWRTTYSCVTDETLPIFRAHTPIYIAGVFTDISVTATAMALFDLNMPVSVIADCVATLHGPAVHESALRSLDHAIGSRQLLTAEELLASL